MLYLDTSVLLPYTLTAKIEPARHRSTTSLLTRIESGSISAATSFYALHELYVFAISNAPDFATGAAYGRAALLEVLSLPLQIFPLLARTERRRHAAQFAALRDASDRPHAIVAAVHKCEAIVTYDSHFQATAQILPCRTPEEIAADL